MNNQQGIFGNNQPGNLFGNQGNQQSGLFQQQQGGQQPNQQQGLGQQQGGGQPLGGGQQQGGVGQQAGGGLFSNSQPGGIFGQATQQQAAGGLFGQVQGGSLGQGNQQQGVGPFGQVNQPGVGGPIGLANQQQNGGGGLFAQGNQQGGGPLGQVNQQQGGGGGLFNQVNQQQSGMFPQANQQQGGQQPTGNSFNQQPSTMNSWIQAPQQQPTQQHQGISQTQSSNNLQVQNQPDQPPPLQRINSNRDQPISQRQGNQQADQSNQPQIQRTPSLLSGPQGNANSIFQPQTNNAQQQSYQQPQGSTAPQTTLFQSTQPNPASQQQFQTQRPQVPAPQTNNNNGSIFQSTQPQQQPSLTDQQAAQIGERTPQLARQQDSLFPPNNNNTGNRQAPLNFQQPQPAQETQPQRAPQLNLQPLSNQQQSTQPPQTTTQQDIPSAVFGGNAVQQPSVQQPSIQQPSVQPSQLAGLNASPPLTTQRVSQPQPSNIRVVQPAQPEQPLVKIPIPNNDDLISIIQTKDGNELVKILSQRNVKERFIQTTQFYQITAQEQKGNKGSLEEDLRGLVFEDKMSRSQFDMLFHCVKSDQRAHLLHVYKKEGKKEVFLKQSRIPIIVALSHQRVAILQTLICLLEKVCYLDEITQGIIVNRQSELAEFIVTLFTTKVKDTNMQVETSRSLMEYLHVSFDKTEEVLNFYLKNLVDTQEQKVIWQMFNSLAQEQLYIIKIYTLITQYYAGTFAIGDYKTSVINFTKILLQTKFQGIVNSPKLYKLLQNQELLQNIQLYGQQIEEAGTIFLLSLVKLPGQAEFLLEKSLDEHEHDRYERYNAVVRNLDIIREDINGLPCFMLFSMEDSLLRSLFEFSPLFSRMMDSLTKCLLVSKEYLSEIFQPNVVNPLFVILERRQQRQETKNVDFCSSLIRLIETTDGDQILNYATLRIIQQWLFMFFFAKTKLTDENDQLDQNATIMACEVLCKLLHNNNLFVNQFWNNYATFNEQGYIGGEILLFTAVKTNFFFLNLLTSLIGVSSQECQFEQQPLKITIDNVIQCLPESLGEVQEEQGTQTLWNSLILQPLLKFALKSGVVPQHSQRSQQFEGLGRRSNASMDYYQSDQFYIQRDSRTVYKNPNQQIISDSSIEQAEQMLVISKFLLRLIETDATKISILELQMGISFLERSYWPTILTILKAICQSQQWCYQVLQNQDPRAMKLVKTLFKISGKLLGIINATLECEETKEIAAYTIGLFGALVNQQNLQQNTMTAQRAQWHPLLEVQDLLNKYQSSQIQGINPQIEKAAQKVQLEILKTLRTLMTWDAPNDYFPSMGRQGGGYLINRDENEIESTLSILKEQFPNFLYSLMESNLYNRNEIEETHTQNFPRQFEEILSKVQARNLGIQTQLIKNLLDVLNQVIIPNHKLYFDSGEKTSFQVLQYTYDIIQLLLQRFITNPYRYPIQQTQIPQIDNSNVPLVKIICDSLNENSARQLIETIISPLEPQMDKTFFEAKNSGQIGPQNVKQVGLTNQFWYPFSKPERLTKNDLKRVVVQILIDSMNCLTLLLKLTRQIYIDPSDPAHHLQTVVLMDTLIKSNDWWYFRKSDDKSQVYYLSLVHSVLACMNIQQEGVAIISKQIQIVKEESWNDFKGIYDQLNIQDNVLYHINLQYRGITRVSYILLQLFSQSTAYSTEIFSVCMRLLSTFALTLNDYSEYSYGQQGLENLITQVRQEHQGTFQLITLKHILSQFLSTILQKLCAHTSPQQLIDALEFFIVCISTQQSVMCMLLKPSLSQQGNTSVQIFIKALGEITASKPDPVEKQQLDMLIVLLLHSIFEKENQYSQFCDLCKDENQDIFLKLMQYVLDGLRNSPLAQLSLLLKIPNIPQNHNFSGVLKHFLSSSEDQQIGYSQIFSQLVLEYCVAGGTTQIITLEYYLKIIMLQLKTEDKKEVLVPLIRDFYKVFDKWCSSLISIQQVIDNHALTLEQLNSTLPQDRTLKIEIQLTKCLREQPSPYYLLQLNIFGPGRNQYIDPFELFDILRGWNRPMNDILQTIITLHRFNLLEGLLRSTQTCLRQLHTTLSLTIASGTDGIPISCFGSNNVQYINSFSQEYISKILKVFNPLQEISSRFNQSQRLQLEEKQRLSNQFANSLIIPNHKKVLIPTGFIGILSGEHNKTKESIGQSYRVLLSILEQVSKSITEVMYEGSSPLLLNNLGSTFNLILDLFSGLQLLLDYQKPWIIEQNARNVDFLGNQSSQRLSVSELTAELVKQGDLDAVVKHQVYLWLILSQQLQNLNQKNDINLVLLQGFCYFMCFFSKALNRINDPKRFIETQLINTPTLQSDVIMIIESFVRAVSKRNDDGEVYLLTYALTATLKIYPDAIKIFLQSEMENKDTDVTKLLLNKLRTRQKQNFMFQGILLFWIDLCQDLDLANYLVVKRNVLESLKHHPDFASIREEQIYQLQNDNLAYNHNHKHIMWCYTLIFVRECALKDHECLRSVLEFINCFKNRIYSTLLSIDQKKVYQSLQYFNQATMLNQPLQQLQPGLLYLLELHQTIMLLTTIVHAPSLKSHFPTEHDKLTYLFTNLIMQQVTSLKRKELYTFIKPFTVYESKLNQDDLIVDGISSGQVDQSLRQRNSIDFSPQSSPNLQNLRQKQQFSLGNASTPKRNDIFSDNRSLSRMTSINIKPSLRLDQELRQLTPFQVIIAIQFSNIWQATLLGLTSVQEQRDINDQTAVRASLTIPLEPNYWVDLSDNIIRIIFINLDLLVNLSHFENIQGLLTYVNLVNCNIDFQIFHGGLYLMGKFPATKRDFTQLLIENVIMGFQAAYQHLQFRQLYREVRFIKESFEMEDVFIKKIKQLIDIVSAEQEIRQFGEQYLNEIYYHGNKIITYCEDLHEAQNYWQAWKDKIEQSIQTR